jgi:outer membrane protein assembly factor BamB
MNPFRTTWAQFQGDSANSGYAAIRTGLASQTTVIRQAKNPSGGSPIVDPHDGAVYVCNRVGEIAKYGVFTVSPEWTINAGTSGQWGSTPAIDSRGRVYAVFSNYMESVLVCLDRRGFELWRWSPPGHSTQDFRCLIFGSPKVWDQSDGGALIFLIVAYQDLITDIQTTLLYAFDHRGIALGAVWFAQSYVFVASGGGGFALAKAHALPNFKMRPRKDSPLVDVEPVVAPERPSEALPPGQHLWEPTVAAIDSDQRDSPIVIATDGAATVAAFQWLGAAGLSPLWKAFPANDGVAWLTPPAVFSYGLLAIGCSDGELKLFDPRSGEALKPWPNLGSRIRGTPASFLRQIYVTTTEGQVAMVEPNGTIAKTVSVAGQIASSAVVTATNVYVATSDRFVTFDLSLNTQWEYQMPLLGMSSPAVGPDGTVYLLANEELWAFAPPHP